jgi:hypothetical protein
VSAPDGAERIRDFEPGRDEAASEALWARCFGLARGGQTLAWLFRTGPTGTCPRAVAEQAGRVVAHAGVAALRFRVEGRELLGGYSVGAMTDPEHQGRGLFVRTAEHLYARLERDGFGFVAGFSNANSHHLHTTRLGRTAVRPFPWCVHVLRPLAAGAALLRGLAGAEGPPPRPAPAGEHGPAGARARPVAPDDPRLDALWARARGEITVGAVRDAAYARWRYASRPDAGYQAWLVETGGAPSAWAVGRVLPLRGLVAGFLLDLLAAPGEEAAGGAALGAFEAWVRARGGQIANALRPSPGTARRVLSRAGYLRVPERLHPQVIRFSVRGFGELAGRPVLADPEAWWLSWADTDVV